MNLTENWTIVQYHHGLEDGWEYEDMLPENLSDEEYSAMFPVSKVDFVRLFPYVINNYGRCYLQEGDWIVCHNGTSIHQIVRLSGAEIFWNY